MKIKRITNGNELTIGKFVFEICYNNCSSNTMVEDIIECSVITGNDCIDYQSELGDNFIFKSNNPSYYITSKHVWLSDMKISDCETKFFLSDAGICYLNENKIHINNNHETYEILDCDWKIAMQKVCSMTIDEFRCAYVKPTDLDLKNQHVKLWTWLSENPTKSKNDWPGWKKLNSDNYVFAFRYKCFACQKAKMKNEDEFKLFVDCNICLLKNVWLSKLPMCVDIRSSFNIWLNNNHDYELRRVTAMEIAMAWE